MTPKPAVKPSKVSPAAKPKAYSYLRFSTPEQAAGDSFRRQTKLAEDYCLAHGMELDRELSLHDLGVSAFRGDNATSGNLGAFRRAIEQGIVEPGSFLLVESLDRVSRTTARKALRILEEIVEAGVTVVTLSDGKQYTAESLDGMDLMWAMMVMLRANEESVMKSRRLKAAWVGKRGKIGTVALTAITPGWMELDDNRRPVLIPERARIVRKIVALALKGTGKETIARQLNTEGVPPFGRASHWHRSYVDKIVTSPALVGTFVPHVEEHHDGKLVRVPQPSVPGYYPAVLDADTYARLQSVAARSPLRGRHAHAEMKNILSGIAHCPQCGSTMTRVTKSSGDKAKLVCVKAKAGAGCEYVSVTLEDVERALVQRGDEIAAAAPAPDAAAERDMLDAQVAVDALEARLEDLMRVLEKAPSTALGQRVAAIEGDLRATRATRDEALERARQSETKLNGMKVTELDVALRARPLDRRRANAALRALVKEVVVDHRHGDVVLKWNLGGQYAVAYAWAE